jgi:hypothetical protein
VPKYLNPECLQILSRLFSDLHVHFFYTCLFSRIKAYVLHIARVEDTLLKHISILVVDGNYFVGHYLSNSGGAT